MNPQIEPFFDTRTSTLTYVVWDQQTRDAVVIDPVLDYEPRASRTWTESVDVVLDFVRAVTTDGKPTVDGEAGKRALETAIEITSLITRTP